MTARALMIQGTTSDAGKSVLVAALCRILLQDGWRVAPFKAQNMSLNSFVTRDGLEMGRAQVVQAQAARLDPDVRMNPVLLKPSSEVGSQVVVMGRPRGNMSVAEYVRYKDEVWRTVREAYDGLAAEFEVVVLEGAGSPGEVNLKAHDIVNMRMARHARAPVLLAGDIERGGVFASLVGHYEVMEPWERDLLAGYLINRFRGDPSLLGPALDFMKERTGRPVLGVIPYIHDLGLPQEDSVGFKSGLFQRSRPEGDHVEIAVIDLPHIANFTDIEPLLAEPDVFVRVVDRPAGIGRPDAVILPGSKNVIADTAFLHRSGLADAIQRLAGSGTEVIGICGGFQMLGRRIADPHRIEGGGTRPGLGMLPVTTVLDPDKTLVQKRAVHAESGLPVHGYEIHHGRTESHALPALEGAGDAGARQGNVWGTYLHGIFDSDPFRRWFIDRLRQRRGLAPLGEIAATYDLEPALDRLAESVRRHLDMEAVYRLLDR